MNVWYVRGVNDEQKLKYPLSATCANLTLEFRGSAGKLKRAEAALCREPLVVILRCEESLYAHAIREVFVGVRLGATAAKLRTGAGGVGRPVHPDDAHAAHDFFTASLERAATHASMGDFESGRIRAAAMCRLAGMCGGYDADRHAAMYVPRRAESDVRRQAHIAHQHQLLLGWESACWHVESYRGRGN